MSLPITLWKEEKVPCLDGRMMSSARRLKFITQRMTTAENLVIYGMKNDWPKPTSTTVKMMENEMSGPDA